MISILRSHTQASSYAVMVNSLLAVSYLAYMPLGDPHGGSFIYTDEGLPKGVAMVSIPVKNLKRSIEFYTRLLGMKLLSEGENVAILSVGKDMIVLRVSDRTGANTGLFLSTESPYDLHRRLVDEGVKFIIDPKRIDIGLITTFADIDGNIVGAIEIRK